VVTNPKTALYEPKPLVRVPVAVVVNAIALFFLRFFGIAI
jgi:hypothetical protein